MSLVINSNPSGTTPAVDVTKIPALSDSPETAVTTTSVPSAPAATEEGAAASKVFEWNTPRLYASEEGHSAYRTWAVRILSTFLLFPLVLTIIVDVARRIAFAANLTNGKSWSLVDEATGGCQTVGKKVRAVYASLFKPQTVEELNEQFTVTITKQAQKLIDGYKGLNGGYFGNSSFSSPTVLKAEKEIKAVQEMLLNEIHVYVTRNAPDMDAYRGKQEEAIKQVLEAIHKAAGDEPYIPSKGVRVGRPPRLSEVAQREFMELLQSSEYTTKQFLSFTAKEPNQGADLATNLQKGVETATLTQEQAQAVLKDQVQSAYVKGLETSIQAADDAVAQLIASAVKKGIVTEDEGAKIGNSVLPQSIDNLAAAAAKQVAGDQSSTSPVEIRLLQIAKKLEAQKQLPSTRIAYFLNAAKCALQSAHKAVEAETLRQKQETAELKAKQAAEVQKAADQASLLEKFVKMLGLIHTKQDNLATQFLKFNKLEEQRSVVTSALREIQDTVVTVGAKHMLVLDAASQYYQMLLTASDDRTLTPMQKQKKLEELKTKQFSQQTIDKIQELRKLEPQLQTVIDQQAALSADIVKEYGETEQLRSVYTTFKKHSFNRLESRHGATVTKLEKSINAAQEVLAQQHNLLTQVHISLFRRFSNNKAAPLIKPVNTDPAVNKMEVEGLVNALEKPVSATS